MSGKRGRRPGDSGARADILAAARRLFAEQGYPVTTLRQVAAAAGVDVRLVSHYFGSKSDLFVSAVELPIDPTMAFPPLTNGPIESLGQRVAEFVLGRLEDPIAVQTMSGLIRAAASEDEAATMVRERIVTGLLLPLARQIGTDHPDLRAALLGSQVAGLILARHVVAVPPLAQADTTTLVKALAPVFQHYLTGPLT